MLAKSQLAFLRDPVLVGDAVGVGGTQDATVSVTRGGTVRVEIAEADRGEVSQLRPVFVVTACEGAFDAGTAAPIVDVEDCCSCILQRSTMSHHRRQMLAGPHLGAESKQLRHDAHAFCRARHTRAGWLGGWGRAAKAHGVANLAPLLAPDIWGAFINSQNGGKGRNIWLLHLIFSIKGLLDLSRSKDSESRRLDRRGIKSGAKLEAWRLRLRRARRGAWHAVRSVAAYTRR